jgi:hypothetical protein
MEPKSSLPRSQKPTNGPYLRADEASPHLSTLFPYDPF